MCWKNYQIKLGLKCDETFCTRKREFLNWVLNWSAPSRLNFHLGILWGKVTTNEHGFYILCEIVWNDQKKTKVNFIQVRRQLLWDYLIKIVHWSEIKEKTEKNFLQCQKIVLFKYSTIGACKYTQKSVFLLRC